jgi:hypothetical protein
LEDLESAIVGHTVAQRGGDFDAWDLDVRGGLAGSARVSLAIEEHGDQKQLLRWRVRPRASRMLAVLAATLGVLALIAARDGRLDAGLILGALGGWLAVWIYRDCSFASGATLDAIRHVEESTR